MPIPNFLKSFYFYGGLIVIAGTLIIWIKGIPFVESLYGHLLLGDVIVSKSLLIGFAFLFSLILILIIATTQVHRRNKSIITIADPAVLLVWNLNGVTCEVTVKFIFKPNISHKATAFANAIELSDEFYCNSCGAGTMRTFSGTTSYIRCGENKGHFDMDEDNEFFRLKQKHLAIVKGIVRQNYKKYWKIYKNELSRVAPGKLEDYKFSWNKYEANGGKKSW